MLPLDVAQTQSTHGTDKNKSIGTHKHPCNHPPSAPLFLTLGNSALYGGTHCLNIGEDLKESHAKRTGERAQGQHRKSENTGKLREQQNFQVQNAARR